MASLLPALNRVRHDALAALDRTVVERVCDEFGHAWRDRELDPATTVALFLQQVLHGNVPCSEVRHLAGQGFTASAYCQARSRLPLKVMQSLLTRVVDAALPETRLAGHLWLGRHRVFHVDGSTFSMPDTPPLRKAFGLPSGQAPGCGFPVAHLLVLFSAQTGLLIDAWAAPLRTGDVSQMPEAHLHLDAGDVLVADVGFGGYAELALLVQSGLHALLPVHPLRLVDFTKGRAHCDERDPVAGVPRSRWIKSLGKEDQLVEYVKPCQRALWMTQAEHDALPESIVVREVRRTVERPGGRAAGAAAPPLGRGDGPAPPEDDDEHGRVAVQERGRRAQGAGGVLPGVQPGARRDAGGGPAAGGAGGAGELHRRAQVGPPRQAGRRAAGPDAQPRPAQPRRAALQEAAGQAIRPDE
jgi:hypothetical protein